MSSQRFLSRKAAAEFIKDQGVFVEPSTLAKYATVGGGPEMRKFGRRVLYEPQALEAWIDSKLTGARRSTSDIEDGR
jgi:hypothetical protein